MVVRRLQVILGLAVMAPLAASACSTCFGAADDAQTKGMNAAILVLIAFTAGVMMTLASTGAACVVRARRQDQRPTPEDLP